jgi:hypothetical protein
MKHIVPTCALWLQQGPKMLERKLRNLAGFSPDSAPVSVSGLASGPCWGDSRALPVMAWPMAGSGRKPSAGMMTRRAGYI